jgi:hypothetical protein
MLSLFVFVIMSLRLMNDETLSRATDDDVSRNGAQSRDNARNDAQMRDASRQGATLRDMSSYTLTVDQAVELMAAGGFPRSKRAIQRFCALGHLECSRVATELGEKYFITRESVERRIKELGQIHALNAAGATGSDTVRHEDVAPLRDEARQATQSNDMSQPDAPLRDEARTDPDQIEKMASLEKENEKLRDENLNLKIDNRAKEHVITILNKEREGFIGRIERQATRIGEMAAKLLALGAPADEVPGAAHGDNSEPGLRREV